MYCRFVLFRYCIVILGGVLVFGGVNFEFPHGVFSGLG